MTTFRRAFWLIALGTIGLLLALAFDLSEWLRGGFGWRWEYAPAPFMPILLLTMTLIVYLVGAFSLRQRRLWQLLAWVIIGGGVIAFMTTALRDANPLQALLLRTLSSGATAPHAVGASISWADTTTWHQWSAIMPTLPRHAALSPPGAPMWYGLLNGIFDGLPAVANALRAPLFPYQCHEYTFLGYSAGEWASAWFGILMPFVASLGVLPLYAIAKNFFSDDVARYLAIGYALIPTLATFAGSWNTLYPLLALCSFYALHMGIQRGLRGGYVHLVMAGFMAGIASFINFALMPMFLMFGLYTLGMAFWGIKPAMPRLAYALSIGLLFGIGLAGVWGIYWLFTQETPLNILRVALDDHFALDRNYWFWVVMHVWDWVMFAGIALAFISLYGLLRSRTVSPAMLLAWALWLTILITTLSNTARSETARVWSWMSPFLLISAYMGLRHLVDDTPKALRRAWGVVYGLQAFSIIVLGGVLLVFSTDLTAPPPRPAPITEGIAMQATFTRQTDAARVHLVGWHGEYDADQNALVLWMNWTADQPLYDVLWFGATPVSPDGSAGDMMLWQPRESFGMAMRYPTTCWMPDLPPIGDRVIIPLPEDAIAGEWWVSIAVFGDESQSEGRLMVNGELQVGVGGILVSYP